MTSNRIVRTEFFKDRVDGWLSLSGGRLGVNPGRASSFGARGAAGAAPVAVAPAGFAAAAAALREPPPSEFSFVYSPFRLGGAKAGVSTF